MRAYDLIRSRRTIRDFEPTPVPAVVVRRCLEAAACAPNRRLTEPWRFVVATGGARAALAQAAADYEAAHAPIPGEAAAAPLRSAPVAVAVWQTGAGDPETALADRLAVAAAIENLLLCAWDEGIGGLWIGGGILHDPALRASLAIAPQGDLVGVVALGYPEAVPPLRRRRSVEEFITWRPAPPGPLPGTGG